MIDNHQFYPPPEALSIKDWETIKNQHFVRVLEPSAGEGHLLRPGPYQLKSLQNQKLSIILASGNAYTCTVGFGHYATFRQEKNIIHQWLVMSSNQAAIEYEKYWHYTKAML